MTRRCRGLANEFVNGSTCVLQGFLKGLNGFGFQGFGFRVLGFGFRVLGFSAWAFEGADNGLYYVGS